MTPGTDYGEAVKKRVAEQLAQFLLLKGQKPESVVVTVIYHETVAKINIDIDDITAEEPSE